MTTTVNGIGTRFYGISIPDERGESTATLWFTIAYLPILPIKRYIIKRAITKASIFRYTIIQKTPLKIKEIFIVYFLGWIVTPIFLLWPLPFIIKEVAMKIGYTNNNGDGTLYNLAIYFFIAWIVFAVFKWKSWDDKKGLPKNYKEHL